MINGEFGKNIKTDKDRINTMIEFLTESHLDTFGGYPYDWLRIGDKFIIAELDDGKERNCTMLRTYKKSQMIAWCKRAEKYREKHTVTKFEECLYETA